MLFGGTVVLLLTNGSAHAVGKIVGNIDGISQDGDHYFISGWACQQEQSKSVAVQLFAEHTENGVLKDGPILAERADLYSEPGVGEACHDRGAGQHRFEIVLPYGYGPESKLSVHGIRIVDGVPNDLIAGSGTKLPLRPLGLAYQALPSLAGAYRTLSAHPGVFVTTAELKDLAARINRPASYSMQRFGRLGNQIKQDLASGIDWDATYSGSDGGVYQYAFSYEPQDQHDAEIRAALKIPSGVKAPAGAAVVAARLALYAALLKAGAVAPPGARGADEASALGKRILLAWADRGFRDASGHFLALGSFDRDGHGRPQSGLGLVLGRGIIYSVHAQDLLLSLGVLDADEVRRLDAFHSAIFDLMRQSENVLFAGVGFPYSACSRYTNIATHGVVGMLATARLLNDEQRVRAVIFGGDPAIPVLVPWVRLFDHIVYGESDGPAAECVNNQEPDSQTSLLNHHDYQTPTAAPGEISDRFRNAKPGQGIGYPMLTLERLLDAAEIMRIIGFDPYGYRGAHRQSIEMAIQYYACYAKSAGFNKAVSEQNSRSCPNAAQYYGKLVTGVERMLLVGAVRFPHDAAIADLEADARREASTGAFSNDAILFGKWRD
ncbi:MAG: hypothetical protein JO347_06540 [Candidatus Eremiobacteraeota bacterium]|nr:hypothetical protein [Candidatus Eremiobacteraeota bacterium]